METTKKNLGICRFCGQIIDVQAYRGLGIEYDEDYLASRFCDCKEAQDFNRAERAADEGEEEREKALQKARRTIDLMFGAIPDEGRQAMTENVREMVYSAAELTYDGFISRAAITDENGITAKISMNSRGKLKITRSETLQHQAEV